MRSAGIAGLTLPRLTYTPDNKDTLHMLMRWFPDRIAECCTKFARLRIEGAGSKVVWLSIRSNKWCRGSVPKEESFPRLPRKTPTEIALLAAAACRLPPAPHTRSWPSPDPPHFFFCFRVFDSAHFRRRLGCQVAPSHNPPRPSPIITVAIHVCLRQLPVANRDYSRPNDGAMQSSMANLAPSRIP